MRTLAVLALFAIPVFVLADEKSDLVIELTATKELYPDEQVVVKAVVRNTGKADAYVVRAIDGSFDGLRSVVGYRWVVKQNGQSVPRRGDVKRIDNFVNAFEGTDLLLVKPGKEVDPQVDGFGNFTSYHDLRVPGKYTVALRYELNPTGTEKVGPGGPTALEIIAKQPAVLIESKPVEVTVLPFPAAVNAAADKVKLAEAKAVIVRQFAETVAKNPNATAEERDAAADRLKRAEAALAEATADHAKKMDEFKKKRDEERKKK